MITYTVVYDVIFQRKLLPPSTQQGIQHENQVSMDTHLSNSTASDQGRLWSWQITNVILQYTLYMAWKGRKIQKISEMTHIEKSQVENIYVT